MHAASEAFIIAAPQQPALICEACGRPEAVPVGERYLCAGGFSLHGSCCPELGADDLWREEGDSWRRRPGRANACAATPWCVD